MLAQRRVVARVGCDRQAVYGTDVDARVALDAEARREVRLNVAVETALDLFGRLRGVEPKLDFDVQAHESLRELRVRHLRARDGAIVVAVAPRVHADFGADEIHPVGGTFGQRHVLTM